MQEPGKILFSLGMKMIFKDLANIVVKNMSPEMATHLFIFSWCKSFRLEEAVCESQKRHLVNLDVLISNCKNASSCVQMLLPMEEDSLKLVSTLCTFTSFFTFAIWEALCTFITFICHNPTFSFSFYQ